MMYLKNGFNDPNKITSMVNIITCFEDEFLFYKRAKPIINNMSSKCKSKEEIEKFTLKYLMKVMYYSE